MKPYYEHGGIAIYHGDCLDVLDAVDLGALAAVVMDPPYASGTRTEASKPASGAMLRGERWAGNPIENDQMTTAGFVWLMREALMRCRTRLVDGASVLAFIDWRQWPNLVGAVESANLRVQAMLVWDKEHLGMGNGFRGQHELILHAAKGVPRIFDRSKPNVLRHVRDANTDHPSPKPVGLMETLLGVVTEPGDVLLDPFMGAGATLVAPATRCRTRAARGSSQRYCEIAAERLSQEVLFGVAK